MINDISNYSLQSSKVQFFSKLLNLGVQLFKTDILDRFLFPFGALVGALVFPIAEL